MNIKKKSFISKDIIKNYDRKFNLLMSIYIGLGIALFILLHSTAAIYYEMMDQDLFTFSVNDAIILSLCWGFLSFFLIYIILNLSSFKRIIGYIGILTIMITGLLAFSLIQGGINVYNIGYLFALCIIFGMAYNLKLNLSKELPPSIDYLKLEHHEILQYIQIISWCVIIVFIGTIVATLYPSLERDTPLEAIGLMLINHAALVIYYLIGVWFGTIVQLFKHMNKIKIEIAKIK